METYTCPTCQERIERDLLVFVRHTDQHILEEMEREYAEWSRTAVLWRKLFHFTRNLRLENYHGLAAKVHY